MSVTEIKLLQLTTNLFSNTLGFDKLKTDGVLDNHSKVVIKKVGQLIFDTVPEQRKRLASVRSIITEADVPDLLNAFNYGAAVPGLKTAQGLQTPWGPNSQKRVLVGVGLAAVVAWIALKK